MEEPKLKLLEASGLGASISRIEGCTKCFTLTPFGVAVSQRMGEIVFIRIDEKGDLKYQYLNGIRPSVMKMCSTNNFMLMLKLDGSVSCIDYANLLKTTTAELPINIIANIKFQAANRAVCCGADSDIALVGLQDGKILSVSWDGSSSSQPVARHIGVLKQPTMSTYPPEIVTLRTRQAPDGGGGGGRELIKESIWVVKGRVFIVPIPKSDEPTSDKQVISLDVSSQHVIDIAATRDAIVVLTDERAIVVGNVDCGVRSGEEYTSFIRESPYTELSAGLGVIDIGHNQNDGLRATRGILDILLPTSVAAIGTRLEPNIVAVSTRAGVCVFNLDKGGKADDGPVRVREGAVINKMVSFNSTVVCFFEDGIFGALEVADGGTGEVDKP